MGFGDVLRNLLEENNYSQKEVAEHLNIAVSTFGNYVRGFREPDFDTLKIFADFFHVSIDYLLEHNLNNKLTKKEERLVGVFRSMSEDEQNIYLEQGKVFLKNRES